MRDLIKVGVILGAHGIRGEVKLKSFTAEPKAIATYGPLAAGTGEVFEIVKLKPATDHFICTLKTVTDRNRAEELRGTELFIARAQLPAGELYLNDLIGVGVYNKGIRIGTIISFENFGAGDLIDVKIEGRDVTVLVPNTKAFIVEASKEKVVVDLPNDYLDEGKQP